MILMLLIRGIKGEAYARKIEEGLVDCRDILSALLEPPVTGYEYSDYYEKNLVKALQYFSAKKFTDLHDPKFLYSLLIDCYIPHIYLTYFHILNEKSLEWLDKFDNDYHFIALNVKIDRNTKCVIGNEFFGARMKYVKSINDLQQGGDVKFCAACMCSIENLFKHEKDMCLPLRIYNTLSFPLLCRECDEKFTDIENEFRIISYDCPRFDGNIWTQVPREATITGETGVKYEGILQARNNTNFKSRVSVLRTPNKLLRDVLIDENGKIKLDSKFKSINISDISDDYKYIGNKNECSDFIKKMLVCKPRDRYIYRTKLKTRKIDKLKNAIFVKGYEEVKY